jgi:hypothetical protein
MIIQRDNIENKPWGNGLKILVINLSHYDKEIWTKVEQLAVMPLHRENGYIQHIDSVPEKQLIPGKSNSKFISLSDEVNIVPSVSKSKKKYDNRSNTKFRVGFSGYMHGGAEVKIEGHKIDKYSISPYEDEFRMELIEEGYNCYSSIYLWAWNDCEGEWLNYDNYERGHKIVGYHSNMNDLKDEGLLSVIIIADKNNNPQNFHYEEFGSLRACRIPEFIDWLKLEEKELMIAG